MSLELDKGLEKIRIAAFPTGCGKCGKSRRFVNSTELAYNQYSSSSSHSKPEIPTMLSSAARTQSCVAICYHPPPI